MKKSILFLLSIGILTLSNSYANTDVANPKVNQALITVNDNISSLCKAAMQGDVEKVRSLIATGEKVNEKSLGMTPAMYAARYNKPEVLKILMLNQANLNIKSDQGYTVKEYAKMSKATQVLAILDSNS
ncbi:ankyrin repeat domain-containing protein [Maribacter sp. PR1]|uniref:Ankyrin repeat domain-containing protein n=1 Tax=Maribacter cobaltidurans TaxID=1178778 RepID=A0ABU7IX77_9FLAO|nr:MULTISPECIES: ankyrin repeat domain-containing protein [Maribacter]MDC6390195.1 ankyrin repeat domain-containing protein [Maribacter sp. PR1]MEE1977585.1 ankyrin repeat domain-containing protein [Maribacter cobaltidurans]